MTLPMTVPGEMSNTLAPAEGFTTGGEGFFELLVDAQLWHCDEAQPGQTGLDERGQPRDWGTLTWLIGVVGTTRQRAVSIFGRTIAVAASPAA